MQTANKALVGIDMGATHLRICLLSPDKQIIETCQEKTAQVIQDGVITGLSHFIAHYLEKHTLSALAIVAGFPALVADKRTIISTPNLNCAMTEFDGLAESLSATFHCPVMLERDVNLQLSHDVISHALQDKLVLGCYIGTGVGFAVWLHGAPFSGAHGVAGELGHIPYGDNSLTCGCGNKGCLETICSGRALKSWYDAEPHAYPLAETFLHDRAHPFLQNLVTQSAKAVATVVNLFDPDVVILGGGIIDMAQFPQQTLIEQTRQWLRKPLPHAAVTFLPASASSFNGALGAAWIGQQLITG